jgi:hypothetical protein
MWAYARVRIDVSGVPRLAVVSLGDVHEIERDGTATVILPWIRDMGGFWLECLSNELT